MFTSRRTEPLRIRAIRNAPIRVPTTVCCPPNRLAPPMTAAAMASSSSPNPKLGCPEATCDEAIMPPNPARAPEITYTTVLLLAVLAEAYAEMGDVARAEEMAERALTRAWLMNNRVDGVEALRICAKILSIQKRREEATAALEEALSWARTMPFPYAEGKILREYGMLHVHEREPERARERLSAALEIFRRLGAGKDAEHTWQTLQAPGQIFD
jgi:tetratricopeptide (TPR) repeat protein